MSVNITLRFYEELNDFLPAGRKKVPFRVHVNGNPAVKDVIESLNVPHPEVDLILVNGISQEFDYRVQEGDFISVFPVFELIGINDLKKSGKGLRKTKFILDVHLGKLARYLRLLGFDSLYQNDFDDKEIIRLSVSGHRIILTRDKGILKNASVTHGYFIRNQNPRNQLAEVIDKFDLKSEIKLFTRCSTCNGKIKKVSKESVIGSLQPLTVRYYKNFYRCTGCGNIYWEGSHFEKMSKWLKSLLHKEMT